MKTYAGTKLIKAEPITRGEYNTYRGWTVPSDENPNDEGYLVVYADGYESWSPRKVFEASYREIETLPFGVALELMKQGEKVSRRGWNGKGMFVYYVTADAYPAKMEAIKQVFGDNLVPYRAYLALKTAQGDVVPWCATQSDILEDDWYVI